MTASSGDTTGTRAALADVVDDLDGAQRSRAGGCLDIHPARPDDPDVADILTRAGRLHRALEPLSPDLPVFGDHDLNPDVPRRTNGGPVRQAAVLIALARDTRGVLSVVLTERAAHLSDHAGQVALPGGKIETGETPTMAATREAEEEVALPPDAVRSLGLFDAYLTRTGFLVVPVLALVTRPVTLKPEPGEVAAAFAAPWSLVMDAAERRQIAVDRDGTTRRFYETMVGERRVWGVTAGIFKMASERLYAP